MRPILALAWAEVLHIARDKATLVQIILIPIVQLLVLSNAATFKIRESSTFVVDHDRSSASRGLITRMAASGQFRIVGQPGSPSEANDRLLRGEVTLVLTIPHDFESSLVRTGTAPVQVTMNAEKGPAAGIVQFYAGQVIARYSAELTRQYHANARIVLATVSPDAPVMGTQRIDVQARSWYNPTQSYPQYMVPGILVALVTLIGTLLAAQNLAREKELGTLEQLNVTPISRLQLIVAKLLPLWVLALGEFSIGIILGWSVFDMPIAGSLPLLFLCAAIYLVAALGIGFLLSTLADTQQQAMFVTFFIVIIYFLLSGLFTPLESMPSWVQIIAEVNPVRHFVAISRAILVKGAGFDAIARPLAILIASAIIVLCLSGARLKRRTD